MHTFLKRSIKIIEESFQDICDKDQDVLHMEKNFNILPEDVKTACNNGPNDKIFETAMLYIQNKNNMKEKKTLRSLYPELLLQFCYPRLDVNVSKGLNHLLKSPFCIHPKTGQVCVPFNPKHVDKFKTTEVPKITQLLNEIDVQDKDKENEKHLADYKKTCMHEYVKIFEGFVKKLVSSRAEKNRVIKEEKTKMELF